MSRGVGHALRRRTIKSSRCRVNPYADHKPMLSTPISTPGQVTRQPSGNFGVRHLSNPGIPMGTVGHEQAMMTQRLVQTLELLVTWDGADHQDVPGVGIKFKFL